MIRIGMPSITRHDGQARVSAEIRVDGKVTELWFEVGEEYGDYLCHERSDAFLLGLLHYAMREGHDIECEGSLTDRLYDQLVDQFLPAYYKINNGSKLGDPYHTKITAPLAPEVRHAEVNVGTGLSCGVDSLHVFAAHKDITHACVWNLHGVVPGDGDSQIRETGWTNLRGQGVSFAKYTGLKLIIGNTNYDRGCLPGLQFDGSTTYGNLFCAFCLQKLWAKYYVASGYDITEFSMTLGVREDPAHYEYMLFSFCSLANIRILLDGAAQNRLQKVGDLIHYEPSKHFLNVCWGIHADNNNCTYMCPKCMRTMLNLDCYGAIEEYREVFDVEYYLHHREQFLAELYRGYVQNNPFSLEMKACFSKMEIPIGMKARAWGIVVKKAIRKALRFGKTNQRFSPV